MWTRKPPKTADLQTRMRWAQDRMAATERLFGFADIKERMRDWDNALANITERRRGQRTKLQGSQLVEEEAVELVKRLKDILKQDGHSTFDAWEKAREQVATIIGVSPATLEDWQRGVNKRQRNRPIEKRRYRVAAAKIAPTKGD
jgi:hypothetical protein